MDVLFENSYIRNKEMIQETCRYIYFKNPGFIVFDIMFGLYFIMNMGLLVLNQQTEGFYSIIFIIFFLAFQLILYYISVKIMVKQDQEITNGNDLHINAVVTNEFIKFTTSTGSVNEIPFSKIKKVMKTKNFILLRTKAMMVFGFRNDSFTKGSAEELLSFLRSKGLYK